METTEVARESESNGSPKSPQQSNAVLIDFMRTFLVPMIPNKMVMLYFGLKYADSPGEGYGYGLAATIIFFLVMIGRFLWKYRDNPDP